MTNLVFKKVGVTLSDAIVIEARYLYYMEVTPYKEIQKILKEKHSLDISLSLLQKAVLGRGGYANVKDAISDEIKKSHVPARIKFKNNRR